MSWVAPGPAWLFCPADRADRYDKAAQMADVVIFDLEDGVAPQERANARDQLREHPFDPAISILRLNAADTSDHAFDVALARELGFELVMLAKTETADQVARLAPLQVVALCESARGIAKVEEITEVPNLVAVMWGSEDLTASLGGYAIRRQDRSLRDVGGYARSRILIAAATAGVMAVDTVYLDFADEDGLLREASDAAAMGFIATPCIHPRQVDVVRRAYQPMPEQVAFARRILEASATQSGVFRLDDLMVDGPVIAQAESVMRRVSLLAEQRGHNVAQETREQDAT